MKRLLLIGLGRMGTAIASRLKKFSWEIVGYSITEKIRKRVKQELGINVVDSYEEFNKFPSPRIFWLMVPHIAVDEVLNNLKPILREGDIVIDGGNSYYKDSQKRYRELKKNGVSFLDVGVSGGILGKEEGFALMIGGDRNIFEMCEDLFRDLSYKGKGYSYLGKSGAGHFAKMVHNGIEYGIMEAIAEGFELLKLSEFDYDLKEVAKVYKNGSIIRSFLIELLEEVFSKYRNLEDIEDYVHDSGGRRWCIKEAIDKGIALPVIAQALFNRFDSQKEELFRNKILAVLRYEFGRHTFRKKD